MSLVFDASAIIRLIELEPNKAFDILRGQYTIDLVYYEIGNYLWKISKSSIINIEPLIKAFNGALSLMNIVSIGLNNDVVNLARKMNITYYDAAYVYSAMKLNTKLVTDDKELIKKFPNITMNISELI